MSLQIRHRPVRSFRNEISDFEREMDHIFSNVFQQSVDSQQKIVPAVDIVENGDQTILAVELPGVRKEDVKLSVENDILTVHATRKDNNLPEKATLLRNEIRTGDFVRAVRLPKGIDLEKISAEITDGILKVTLPKAEELKPRQIRIN